MSVLLAPYNNAMRLGQGFNSYTQQICLTDAVKPQAQLTEGEEDQRGDMDRDRMSSRRQAQIVTYKSQFVDKLSDVTDAMNISASLSIKTSTVGGKASGSYVDSDKFKESDLNFFIQVKVTNQTINGTNYSDFQKLQSVEQTKFAEVYGDTFISGFEEGGELNALISVKVSDKEKVFAIKAELEGQLGTPALSGEVKGSVDLNKASTNSSTETTVTVNWSGGGQIKETNVLWDINSLTLAAANFPELVAATPQKTYAILTKYTALPSFHQKMQGFSVLDYENAGIYTSALLDSYMDYKNIWKQILLANFELEHERADIRETNVPKDILDLETATTNASGSVGTPTSTSTSTSTSSSEKEIAVRSLLAYKVQCKAYPGTTLGLQKARRDCRLEMIKIVNEVDQVTVKPDLALDPVRDSFFTAPSVFRQLLPIVTLRPVDPPLTGNSPSNPVILGVSDEDVHRDIFQPDSSLTKGLWAAQAAYAEKMKHKWRQFSMGSIWAGAYDPPSTSLQFNDLDVIDTSWVPSSFTFWYDDLHVLGVKTTYTNGKEIPHGNCTGTMMAKYTLADLNCERVVQFSAGASLTDNLWTVDLVNLVGDATKGRTLTCAKRTNTNSATSKPPQQGFWSLRGFWGAFHTEKIGCANLGAIWGRDTIESITKPRSVVARKYTPNIELYAQNGLPKLLKESMDIYASKHDLFYLSPVTGSGWSEGGPTVFNDLATIDQTWRLKSVKIWIKQFSNEPFLCGIQPTYTNGRSWTHGSAGTSEYTLDLGSGRTNAANIPAAIEQAWIRAAWSTGHNKVLVNGLRLFSNDLDFVDAAGTGRSTKDEAHVLATPKSPEWTIRGFYGQVAECIDRLGVIWGRDEI